MEPPADKVETVSLAIKVKWVLEVTTVLLVLTVLEVIEVKMA